MKSEFIFCLLISICTNRVLGFDWHGNENWAMNCDFKGQDLKDDRQIGTGANCGPSCAKTTGCTHFVWTTYLGGTCWMKTGSVSKNDAIYKEGAVCGIIKSDTTTNTKGTVFTTVNNCPNTIWVGIDGFSTANAGWKVPSGGFQLNSGQSNDIVMDKHFNGRFWARTNCQTNGQFICETGNCGPWVDCATGGVRRGGATPASLAEFNLNTNVNGLDFYDVSLVDGYNIKMSLIPLDQSCQSITCNQDLNSVCPEHLKVYNSNRQVVACHSPCSKYNLDQYCCRGVFNKPETCITSAWPSEMSNYLSTSKRVCPKAYSYAYDDRTSTYTCRNTNYKIIFC